VNFLLKAGLPWLALRQAARENDTNILDTSWMYFLPHMSVAHKNNCKQMCALVPKTRLEMNPQLKEWYDLHRTASWSGTPSSNMLWDQVQETANNLLKPKMGVVLDANLGDNATRQTGLRAFKRNISGILKDFATRPSPGTRAELGDIQAVVGALKEGIGATWAAFTARAASKLQRLPENRYDTRAGAASSAPQARPWKRIDDERASADLKEYLTRTLTDAPEIFSSYCDDIDWS
jgi:hypothetical protein